MTDSQLELDSPILAWLREHSVEASDNDLQLTYAFVHVLNSSRNLRRCQLKPPDAPSELLWHIEFFVGDGSRVLESPLARLFRLAELDHTAQERVRVAYNAACYVEPRYRGKGFARALYEAEEVLYRRWGVREIHMQAQGDGLPVWIKRFGFLPTIDAGLVLFADYPAWAARRTLPKAPPSSLLAFPDEFLRSRDHLDLYKVLS